VFVCFGRSLVGKLGKSGRGRRKGRQNALDGRAGECVREGQRELGGQQASERASDAQWVASGAGRFMLRRKDDADDNGGPAQLSSAVAANADWPCARWVNFNFRSPCRAKGALSSELASLASELAWKVANSRWADH